MTITFTLPSASAQSRPSLANRPASETSFASALTAAIASLAEQAGGPSLTTEKTPSAAAPGRDAESTTIAGQRAALFPSQTPTSVVTTVTSTASRAARLGELPQVVTAAPLTARAQETPPSTIATDPAAGTTTLPLSVELSVAEPAGAHVPPVSATSAPLTANVVSGDAPVETSAQERLSQRSATNEHPNSGPADVSQSSPASQRGSVETVPAGGPSEPTADLAVPVDPRAPIGAPFPQPPTPTATATATATAERPSDLPSKLVTSSPTQAVVEPRSAATPSQASQPGRPVQLPPTSPSSASTVIPLTTGTPQAVAVAATTVPTTVTPSTSFVAAVASQIRSPAPAASDGRKTQMTATDQPARLSGPSSEATPPTVSPAVPMVITAAAGQQPTARLAAPTTALLSPVIANVPTIAPAETIKQEPASLASVATRSADTAVPIAVAQISTQPFVTPTTTTAASPVQPQTPGQPLNAQIFKPIFNLARAGNGEHTITVNVTPDNLGPVTVHAHVSGKDMRIELFAPTDGGRDALKAIMTDLRRDVAQAGLTAAVDVSTRNQPDSTQSGDRDRREQPFENREPSRREPQTTEAQVPPHVTDGGPTSSTLDVLA